MPGRSPTSTRPAVKEPFEAPSADEANEDAEYQDMVLECGA